MARDKLALVGKVVDNLRFDAIVDEGGFGWVYRGRHLGLDEPVAIKCLKMYSPAGEGIGSFEARFRDETKIAYKLSQGNLDIVRSIASGTLKMDSGAQVPYMVLEWLDGRTIAVEITARRNNDRPPYTLAEAVDLLDSAAGALAHAHAEGVVHRDVKPSNLFVAETRDGRRVKVLDFGLAKILDPEGFMRPESSPTAAHVFVCSPAYGAPEQFSKDLGAIGAWTDVYSFTLVLLELLSHRRVRDAGTLIEGMMKALDPQTSSPLPSTVGVRVSDAVERVFAKSVALQPGERWKDMSEMWAALKAALKAEEKEIVAPTVAEEVPAGAREEIMRRIGEFHAASGGVMTKGGTVAMNPASTVPLRPAPASVVPSPMQIRTLPLDARLPSTAPQPTASASPKATTTASPKATTTASPKATTTANENANANADASANANAIADAHANAGDGARSAKTGLLGWKIFLALIIAVAMAAGAYLLLRAHRG